jgi:predicted NAD/FAD-binding protein
MLQDIRKFFRETSELKTDEPEENPITLGEFLAQRQYGQTFIDKFILPMGAAIWSTKSDDIKNQPLQSFVEFFASHGLLQFRNPVKWQTIIGGSREYVKKITANYHDCIKLGNGVKKIERKPNSVVVFDDQNATHVFDQIVIASHADEALSLLSDADKNERELLSAFKYNDSRVLLHSDESLMPHRKKVWSSWNFLGNNTNGVSVTYWMNLLQSIDNKIPYFVSVNPKFEPNPSLLHNSFQYQHPCFDVKAWEAQKKLWKLQGNNNTWFCGSYFGYGFHEDALQAGLAVAEELGGVERPWKIYGNSARIYRFNGLERVASD